MRSICEKTTHINVSVSKVLILIDFFIRSDHSHDNSTNRLNGFNIFKLLDKNNYPIGYLDSFDLTTLIRSPI